MHEAGDVEFRRVLAPLVVADHLAVDPEVVGAAHRAEAQRDLPSIPLGGNGEAVPVGADRVVVGRQLGWHRPAERMEGVLDVGVDRLAVALPLPVGRHRDGGPLGVVEVVAVEVGGFLRRPPHPVELPAAVERLIPRRRGRLIGEVERGGVPRRPGGLLAGPRREGSVRRLHVPPHDGGVGPVGHRAVADRGVGLLGRKRSDRNRAAQQREQGRGEESGPSRVHGWGAPALEWGPRKATPSPPPGRRR